MHGKHMTKRCTESSLINSGLLVNTKETLEWVGSGLFLLDSSGSKKINMRVVRRLWGHMFCTDRIFVYFS